MAAEQAEMVRRLCSEGDGVAVVIGQAGTGKTYALAAAREAWESSGRRVVGAALGRRAALELEAGAGIESTSIAALLDELRRRPTVTLRRGSVLAIDEAGMVPTRVLAELVEHVERAGAKLVLVGDDRQLPEIGAGGAFRALAARLPAIELHENRRQAAEWEREALKLLRDGDAEGAAGRYEAAGRVVADDDASKLRQRLVAEWWRAGDPGEAVMIAYRRRDVADLNGRAHALMRASGALGETEIAVGEVSAAAGDHVLLRRNDRRLRVVNGERGVVVAIDAARRSVDVRLAGGVVPLDREYLDAEGRGGPALALGYAITGHVAQGMTCRQTFVLATDGLSKEWAYVAMSRGREGNRLYVVRDDAERDEYAPATEARPASDVLLAGLRRSGAQQKASEGDPAARRLVMLAAELATAEREMYAAQRRERAVANRPGPHWFQRTARERREDELRRAGRETAAAAKRVERLRERRAELQRDAAAERSLARGCGARGRADRLQARELRRGDFGIER